MKKKINIFTRNKALIGFLLICLPLLSFSQDVHHVDSLQKLIHEIEQECPQPCEKDSVRLEAYSAWYYSVYNSYPDSALQITNEVIELCEERLSKNPPPRIKFPITMWYAIFVANKGYILYRKGDSKSKLKYDLKALAIKEQLYQTTTDSIQLKDVMESLGYSYINLGYFYHDSRGNIDSAFYYYNKAMKVQKKNNDLRGLSVTLSNISTIHIDQGRIIEALDYALQSLRLKENILANFPSDRNKNVFKTTLCVAYNNIGWFYDQQEDYVKSEEYYRKALKIGLEVNNKHNVSSFLSNIGKTYEFRGNYIEALSYYNQSLEIRELLGNVSGKIESLNNIGRIYVFLDEKQKAEYYFKTGLHLSDSIDDITGKTISLNNLNWVYEKNNNYNKLIQYVKKGYEASQQSGDIEHIIKATKYMHKVAAYQKDYKNAYQYYKLMVQLEDSINNEKTVKETIKKQAGYEYEKKSAIDSVAHHNQMQIKNLAIARVEKEKEQQRTIIYLFVGGFIIILIFLVIIYRLMREKSKANKKLIELDQFKKNMSSMIVHDLKNPLNVIMGMSEKREVKEAASKMNRLVMNILDTQKFEDTQVELQYGDYSLSHIVNTSFEQVEYLAENKDVQLKNKVPKNLTVKSDEELIVRVVINLLLNAVKYSNPGGEVVVTANSVKNYIEITVQDEGKGINKKNLPYIFDKFKGKEITDTEKGIRSTGIGLTFCKLVVEAHGGSISVESEEGKGTVVRFTLLVGEPSKEVELTTTKKEQAKEKKLTKKEQYILLKYADELEKLEVYYLSDIMQLLDQIEETQQGIIAWKKEMKEAVKNCNETKYQKLIHQVKQNF